MVNERKLGAFLVVALLGAAISSAIASAGSGITSPTQIDTVEEDQWPPASAHWADSRTPKTAAGYTHKGPVGVPLGTDQLIPDALNDGADLTKLT